MLFVLFTDALADFETPRVNALEALTSASIEMVVTVAVLNFIF